MASGKVTIYFKGSGTSETTSKTSIGGQGKVQKPTIPQDKGKHISFSSAITRRLVNVATNLIQQVVGYEIDKNYDLSDNVKAKRDKTIATTLVKRVSENVNSAWFGANIGSAFGPIGLVVGAIIGGATDLTKQSIDIAHGYDKQAIEIAKANEQLSYSRLRVGYSLVANSKGEER